MIYIYDGRDKFYQWDINQKLVIENDEVNLVNFSTAAQSQALVCEIYELDGKRVVDVPNILLTDSWDINVYAKCDLCVRETAKFEIVERVKPDDYVYTETEVMTWERLEDDINSAINALNGAEADRVAAELERRDNEALRQDTEATRNQAEESREQAEAIRQEDTENAIRRLDGGVETAMYAAEQATLATAALNETAATFSNAVKGKEVGGD